MKKFLPLLLYALLHLAAPAKAQVDAGLLRFPDVSQSQIVFTYANDIWIIDRKSVV